LKVAITQKRGQTFVLSRKKNAPEKGATYERKKSRRVTKGKSESTPSRRRCSKKLIGD